MESDKNKEATGGYKLIIGYLGIVTMLVGFIVLLPLFTIFAFPEEISNAKYFILPGVLSILVGYLLAFLVKGKEKGQLQKHEDAIIVLVTWTIAITVSSMPFVLTGNYNFTQAIFEATSGFSTTGLSVVDVAVCPKIFLMFRSIMLFFGGVGLVLVMTSVLSDYYGMRLYNAEGHNDRLLPNLITSARLIITIYSGYILSGTILYKIFGMNWFDALNHSIAALSTGGFSTRTENIGYYHSLPIEIISIVLMLLGGTNFLVHLFLIKGKFKAFFSHCEVKSVLFVLAVITPVLSVLLLNSLAGNMSESIRIAVFQAVSALTTTGFQTVPTFTNWTSPALLLMILLMLIGGGAGSTAGGIKQYRVCLIFKELWWNIRDQFFHKRVVRADTIDRFGKKEVVTDQQKLRINAFIVLYLFIFILGSFVFTLFGYSLEMSCFEFASALGTVGLSMGITGYDASPVILWTAIIGMFVGKLEIYVVFLGLTKLFFDIGNKFVKR